MPDTPPTTSPTDQLTPDEEKKFSTFLGKFLADDDAKNPPSPPAPAPTAPPATQGLSETINAILDKRDKDKDTGSVIAQHGKDIEELKQRTQPKKKRPWFSPLFD